MSGEDQVGQVSVLEGLRRMLGRDASEDDLPQLPELLVKIVNGGEATSYEEFCSAIQSEKVRIVPVRWGGPEFDDLKNRIKSKLTATARNYIDVQAETDRYDVFQWMDELRPTIGLFPFYLIKNRRHNWCIIKLGYQERICIAMLPHVAMSLKERGLLPVSRIDKGGRRVLNADAFRDFLKQLDDSEQLARFFSFGRGHAAPRILADILNSSTRRYFIRSLSEYNNLTFVEACQLKAAFNRISNDESQPALPTIPEIREKLEVEAWREDFQRSVWEASIFGLAEQMKRPGANEYDFVVSDLGAAEFQKLLEVLPESREQIAGELLPAAAGNFADKHERLVVWEIEHGEDIPLGIGISAPGLVRMFQNQDLSKIIHDEVAAWLKQLGTEGKIHKMSALYGLRLEDSTAHGREQEAFAVKSAELDELIIELYESRKHLGTFADSIIESRLKDSYNEARETLTPKDLDAMLGRIKVAIALSEQDKHNEYVKKINNIIEELGKRK